MIKYQNVRKWTSRGKVTLAINTRRCSQTSTEETSYLQDRQGQQQ